MAVYGLGQNDYNYANYTSPKAKGKAEDEEIKNSEEVAASTEETKAVETPAKQKSEIYKPDMDKIRETNAENKNNIGAFRQMAARLFKGQSGVASKAMKDLFNIDGYTQESAQAAIAEDGEWGVEATANRLLDFAKSLAGDDPSKIEELKEAVMQGFKAAEKLWGGKLPDISYKTMQRVMEGFDEWEKSFNTGTDAEVADEEITV